MVLPSSASVTVEKGTRPVTAEGWKKMGRFMNNAKARTETIARSISEITPSDFSAKLKYYEFFPQPVLLRS